MDQGYVHIYTGDGKGKTTAAFGLAVQGPIVGSFGRTHLTALSTQHRRYPDGIALKKTGQGQ